MAAEIDSGDIISKAAIEEPLLMKKNIDELLKSIDKLLNVSKQSEANVIVAKSVGGVAKETEKLTIAQKELVKIQNQVATAQAKNNQAYQDEAEKLAAIKKEMKDTATASKNLSGSYNEFNKQVTDAKKKLKEMEGGLQGTSKEFKDLQKFVADGSQKLKEWDKNIGDNQRNVGDYEGAMRKLKLEFKAAKDEMAGISQTLGVDSKEFQAAALKAGSLKDEIEDLSKATKNVSGSKLENLSSTFGDVFTKLKGGDFKGGLEAAKQFATVSKSISFGEAATSIKQFGQTIGTVGKAILTNPIFLLSAVIVGLAVAMYKFRDSIPFVSKALSVVGDTIDYGIKKLKEFTDWLGLTTFAQDEKRKSLVENAQKEIDSLKKSYDIQIRLAEAAGKDASDIEKRKWEEIVKASRNGIKALVANGHQLNDEEKKNMDELAADLKDAKVELLIIQAKANRERKEAQKFANEQLRRMQFKDQSQSLDDQLKYYMDSVAIAVKGTSMEKEIKAAAAKGVLAVQKDVAAIEIAEIEKNNDKKLEAEQKLQDSLQNLKAQAFQTATDLANNFFDNEANELDARKNRLETMQAAELTAAGNNANAKAAIESKYAAQIKEIDNQQRKVKHDKAVADKALAAFKIAIDTSLSIMNAFAEFPYPAALGISIALGATGALQLAAVLTKPIPKFAKGVEGFGGGLAVVGEEGSELLKTGNQLSLTPDHATIMRLPKGTDVIPHEDTMRALAYASLGREVKLESENKHLIDYGRLADIQSKVGKKIVQAINSNAIDLVEQGSILNRHIKLKNGNSKIVRQKAMGE